MEKNDRYRPSTGQMTARIQYTLVMSETSDVFYPVQMPGMPLIFRDGQ